MKIIKNNFNIVNQIKKYFKLFIFQINKKSNIVKFDELGNILRVLVISYIIYFFFNLAQTNSLDNLRKLLIDNFWVFSSYLTTEIMLLMVSSFFIKKIRAGFAIIYLFFTTLFSTYLVYSLIGKGFLINPNDFEEFAIIVAKSLSVMFFFIIYFDWKVRVLSPLDDIAKVNFLQSKMDPHFIFNCLNTAAFLVKKDPNAAKEMINNLSELIRATVRKKELTSLISLGEEIGIIEKYLQIEDTRMGERLLFEIEYEDNAVNWKIPQFSIQPLVENAIIHGLNTLDEPKPIKMKIYTALDDCLHIEIFNFYKLKDSLNNGNKIALQNLKERLNLYYQGLAEMYVLDRNNSFYVHLKIPKESYIKIS